jgi:putative DNA primase/helicase
VTAALQVAPAVPFEIGPETGTNVPEFSDEAIALAFADIYDKELRYVAQWGRWLHFDGKKWVTDTTMKAHNLARRVCREYAAASEESEKVRCAIASASTMSAVERLARSDRRLAATVDQWDTEPFYLNTPDGVVNLRSGARYNHFPEYHLTKMTAVGPGGDCPLWHKVLDRVTDGNTDLQRYLARVFGYAATGSTKEHALFFCYGNGANGKSVVLNTVANIMGDYAKTAPISTFTASGFEGHPTDLAGLRGARMVVAIETEEGRQWAEARIKALTGGDRISARFMRQDFFEFTPQFKLVIAGNHKPTLRSVDEAIARRFNVIPFNITIPAADRDPDLSEKLKAEWPGILAWIIEGCREWQQIGLRAPQIVTQATAEYLDQQDSLTAWLTEDCQTGPEYSCGAQALFNSWAAWAKAAGIYPGKRNALLDSLRAKGFHSGRTNAGETFRGIRVTPQMTGDYS